MLSFKIILLEPHRMLSLHLVLIPVIMFLINPEKDLTSDVITVCQFLALINIKTVTHMRLQINFVRNLVHYL